MSVSYLQANYDNYVDSLTNDDKIKNLDVSLLFKSSTLVKLVPIFPAEKLVVGKSR